MIRVPVPSEAVGLKLYKIDGDELVACESVRFAEGTAAVELALRRASICGRVEVDGEIENHFADLLDDEHDIVATVALDRDSYRVLKNKWARCKLEPTT